MNVSISSLLSFSILAFSCVCFGNLHGLPLQTEALIDKAVMDALKDGPPSASVAIVKKDQIAFAKAYKDAQLSPRVSATPEMAYHIGSVSKQFTATAILMLAEEGKLSLDDSVARFLPQLTRAEDITIRQLLSHTSGYQDFWPEDYVPPMMKKPTTIDFILKTWAEKPLNFEPGTQYQYSNTGYVIAGVIVEKASGMPLFRFLKDRIFDRLGMHSVIDISAGQSVSELPVGYLRNALGPLRPAPKEGINWLFGCAELAMTATDLARWNIALINKSLLKPQSYAEMEREVLRTDGLGIKYGLGLEIDTFGMYRVLKHEGEVSGFTSENLVFPDEGVAISVFVNQDAINTSTTIAQNIAAILFADSSTKAAEASATQMLAELQKGQVNRTTLTSEASAYFSQQVLADFASSLSPLGTAKEVVQSFSVNRGGMLLRVFKALFNATMSVVITERIMPDGKIEQFMVIPS